MTGPMSDGGRAVRESGALNREAYFAAAYELLGERGCEGLSVVTLCARLGVTRGSFYHHFEGWPAFVAAFVECRRIWLSELFAYFGAMSDPFDRFEAMANSPQAFSASEAGFRSWARTEPVAAAALHSSWQAASETAAAAYGEILGDRLLGHVIQQMAACVAMGFQLRCRPLADERLLLIEQELGRRVLGAEFDIVATANGPALRRNRRKATCFPADPAWDATSLPHVHWADVQTTSESTASGTRTRDRAGYFAAARELLAEGGSDAVTVEALCRRLAVTKGSFNWHFEGMGAFVEALADHWENAQDRQLAHQRDESDLVLGLQRLLQQLLSRPDPDATAWRAWAHKDPVVGYVVRRTDRRRQELLAGAIRAATGDPAAELLGEATLELSIGMRESEWPSVDPELACRIVLEWARRVLRIDAELQVEEGRPRLALRLAGNP